MASAMTTRQAAGLKQTPAFTGRTLRPRAVRASRPQVQVTRALSDVNVVIGGATALSLALGRFVFLPYQRKTNAKAGLPVQNGETHFQAGDKLAQEASFVLKTNDPAGFNLIDVAAWGSLGHAIGYAALATASIANTL